MPHRAELVIDLHHDIDPDLEQEAHPFQSSELIVGAPVGRVRVSCLAPPTWKSLLDVYWTTPQLILTNTSRQT